MTSGQEKSDWIEAARQGEEWALHRMIQENHGRVYGCALKILKDSAAAEDAAQETFLRAWKAVGDFDGRSAIGTWLYRICVNVCLTKMRTHRRRQSKEVELRQSRISILSPPEDPQNGPEERLLGHELQLRVEEALEQLPESLRTTVTLVLLHGMPQSEAAEVMGCSVGTVAWRVHEARKRLRRKLRDLLEHHPSVESAKSRGVS